jgi:hypothetical protein
MMIKEENIVFLKITSWYGISVGAEHYYGKLTDFKTNENIELTYPLTKEDAKYLNKKEKIEDEIGYEEGEESERFRNEEAVIERAKKQFKILFPKATILVRGTSDPNPQEVLVGPKQFKNAINVLWQRCELLDWDREEDEEELEEIYGKWEKLWPRKYF